ncbi:MAG: exonuclease SbcCD subunit D [Acidobacteriota bacterium]
MTKFLHIADIHLGIRRYRSDERTRDFFLAWKDCLEKYAVREQVSFVLIAGDFFDVRRVEPQAMNQAIAGLELLRDAGIPALVIEGNHDQHEATSRFSWLRSLSQWGFLKLLEPEYRDGRPSYSRWDEERREGSFIDLDDVRVFGSSWYGSTGSLMLPRLVDELRPHRSHQHFNILMLHTDVEGQLNRPIPAVSVEKLSELKAVTDYLALGHTHKNFEIDGWIFNPGSLEACNVDEFDYRRGAYLVELIDGRARARLVEDYYRRPTHSLQLDVSADMTPEIVEAALLTKLERELGQVEAAPEGPAPIIDIVFRGTLGFDSALLEVNRLRDDIRKKFDPLLVLVRNKALPHEYSVASGLAEHISRSERERRVIEELIGRDARFRNRAAEMTSLVLEAKRMALNDEDGSRIAELIAHQIATVLPSSQI